ncbi:MAG TPA: sigma-54 dependent transcriptional regulator [Nitrospirota bacterium]|jgi:DNA-binding NtrC family response regulator
MAYKIVCAEDEEITLRHLTSALRQEGYEVFGAGNGMDALKEVEGRGADLIIADVKMPRMTGLELLEKVKEDHPETEVIIITGFGSIGSAVDAVKAGAYDYITKPFDLDELVIKVNKIMERKTLKKQNTALRAYIGLDRKLSIIANSPSMKKILGMVEEMKESDCNILLTGESGVGKSLLAKIIHSTSRRHDMPFLSINCATLTEELLASELFGHEKGAFTGAVKTKQGLVEIADTGTLFLDEVSEMAPKLQAKLLKVIEDGEFYRVGGTKPIRVDVRFIAATNQVISEVIASGRLREDLYYRLNVMEIFIPPLRQRREDIEPLCKFFLSKHLPETSKKLTGFDNEAMKVLKGYSYPGNVRELENIIERAIILAKEPIITLDSIPSSLAMFQFETIEPGKLRTIEELNKDYVEQVLEMLGGNKTKASEVLGISRTSLWRILREE